MNCESLGQEVHSKSRARHQRSLKLGWKLKYLNIDLILLLIMVMIIVYVGMKDFSSALLSENSLSQSNPSVTLEIMPAFTCL